MEVTVLLKMHKIDNATAEEFCRHPLRKDYHSHEGLPQN